MSSVALKNERVPSVMIVIIVFVVFHSSVIDQALVFKADSECMEVSDGAGVCSALRHV